MEVRDLFSLFCFKNKRLFLMAILCISMVSIMYSLVVVQKTSERIVDVYRSTMEGILEILTKTVENSQDLLLFDPIEQLVVSFL